MSCFTRDVNRMRQKFAFDENELKICSTFYQSI